MTKPLTIAIDARMIRRGAMHGIARYVYHLLLELAQQMLEHQIYVIVNKNSPLDKIQWPSHILLVKCKSSWISFREQAELPAILKEIKADLFHAPSFVAPFVVPCRMVMTIHDLNHMVLPQFYTPIHQFYYQVIVRNSIKRSEYILTVSQFSKSEIVRTLKVPKEKIFVTYNGVSSEYYPRQQDPHSEYILELYGIKKPFIFCVSNNKPHKNVHQLVRAYCYSNVKVPLVLASPVDRKLINMAEAFGKKHLLFFSKFIEEEHLPIIYSNAELFVYPSTYEGFGLPPLEAISCGVPVVVSASSSLPEVVGDSAIFVNPYDYKDIASALERGLNDKEYRARLIDAGLQHAQKYSWSKMTKETLALYERCLMDEQPMAAETSAEAQLI